MRAKRTGFRNLISRLVVAGLIAMTFQGVAIIQPANAAATLITHAAHQSWLEELAAAAGGRLQLRFVASLPAAVWQAEQPPPAAGQCGADEVRCARDSVRRPVVTAAPRARVGYRLPAP